MRFSFAKTDSYTIVKVVQNCRLNIRPTGEWEEKGENEQTNKTSVCCT